MIDRSYKTKETNKIAYVVLKILKILGMHRLHGDLKKFGIFFVILKLAGITFAFNFGN